MASNYTEDELYLIASLPHTIGAAMAFVGHSGLFGTGKEMFVSATSILNGVKEYPSNALIQAILPNLQEDRQEAMGKMQKFRDWTTARMKRRVSIQPRKCGHRRLKTVVLWPVCWRRREMRKRHPNTDNGRSR